MARADAYSKSLRVLRDRARSLLTEIEELEISLAGLSSLAPQLPPQLRAELHLARQQLIAAVAELSRPAPRPEHLDALAFRGAYWLDFFDRLETYSQQLAQFRPADWN